MAINNTFNNTKIIGQMNNKIDHTHESANRVYSVYGCSHTINTCGGGNLEPKVIQKNVKLHQL